MNTETIIISKDNINNYLGLEIVAFHWAACGACGIPGEVIIITRDGRVFETNYVYPVYGITPDDLIKLFPPLSDFRPGIMGGGYYPPLWKDKYLGLGNYLVVHDSIWKEFLLSAQDELITRNNKGERIILYNIWGEVVLSVLNNMKIKESHE